MRAALWVGICAALVVAAISTVAVRHWSAPARANATASANETATAAVFASSGQIAVRPLGPPPGPNDPLLSSDAAAIQSQPSRHTVTIQFDYDFTKTPACSRTVKLKCVTQFNVYEVSGLTPIWLFSIPAPSGANKFVAGITGTSSGRIFFPGPHRFGVSARTSEGTESDPRVCLTFATVGPVAEAASPSSPKH
jgi:hypothetical protein